MTEIKSLFSLSASLDTSLQSRKAKIASRLFDVQSDYVGQKRTYFQAQNEAQISINLVDQLSKEEFEGKSDFNADFMPKLQKWINQKRFQVSECDDGSRNVRISDMFDFKVEKKEKTDVEKVEAELKIL